MQSNEIPDRWKTDHLFLLVGGNPLPNYIAAMLLLNDQGLLHLICSKESEEIATKLGSYFSNHFVKHILEDPADRGEIQRVVGSVLQYDCKEGSIGLHYTGGTKTMAVQVHQIVREIKKEAVFTYLDARTLTMRCDGSAAKPKVRLLVEPGLERLLDMHQLSLNNEHIPKVKPILPELDQLLAEGHASKKAAENYSQWCKESVQPYKYEYMKFQKEKAENAAEHSWVPKALPFPTHSKLQPAVQEMRRLFGVTDDQFDPETVPLQQLNMNSVDELLRYLLGDWVEYLALQAFLTNQQSYDLYDVKMSIKTTPNPNHFEFDVAAMRGYQLYVVSCTRSTFRDLNKGKLFEVCIRAAQLGGDEARVALVCCETDSQRLEKEVTDLMQISTGRVKVFGASDLPFLSDSFAQWLDS